MFSKSRDMQLIRMLLVLQVSSIHLYQQIAAIESNNSNEFKMHSDCAPDGVKFRMKTGKIGNGINFIELNGDVLLMIFEHLNSTTLLNLAMASPHLSPIVADQFRRKYKDYDLRILDTTSRKRNELIEYSNYKQIDIYGLQMAIKFVKHFGGVIKNFELRQLNIPQTDSMIISQAMVQYCTKSLTKLNLDFIKENTLEQFIGPFENVDSLHFSISRGRFRTRLPLNQLFPKVKEIHVSIFSDTEYDFFNTELPTLESLFVLFLIQRNDNFAKSFQPIESLMRNNKQIESLHLVQSFPNLHIQTINKLLPNLKNLKLGVYEIDAGNDTVHFEQVKEFSLSGGSPKSIKSLSFPRLQSLNMQYTVDFFES